MNASLPPGAAIFLIPFVRDTSGSKLGVEDVANDDKHPLHLLFQPPGNFASSDFLDFASVSLLYVIPIRKHNPVISIRLPYELEEGAFAVSITGLPRQSFCLRQRLLVEIGKIPVDGTAVILNLDNYAVCLVAAGGAPL
jgi:hypothetical protein